MLKKHLIIFTYNNIDYRVFEISISENQVLVKICGQKTKFTLHLPDLYEINGEFYFYYNKTAIPTNQKINIIRTMESEIFKYNELKADIAKNLGYKYYEKHGRQIQSILPRIPHENKKIYSSNICGFAINLENQKVHEMKNNNKTFKILEVSAEDLFVNFDFIFKDSDITEAETEKIIDIGFGYILMKINQSGKM